MTAAPTERGVLPSIKQMLVRANSAHLAILRAHREGRELVWRTAGEARGYRIAGATLFRWNCIDNAGITPRGNELLDAARTQGGEA